MTLAKEKAVSPMFALPAVPARPYFPAMLALILKLSKSAPARVYAPVALDLDMATTELMVQAVPAGTAWLVGTVNVSRASVPVLVPAMPPVNAGVTDPQVPVGVPVTTVKKGSLTSTLSDAARALLIENVVVTTVAWPAF